MGDRFDREDRFNREDRFDRYDRGDRCDRLFASVFLWGGGGELKGENWDGNWG